MKECPICVEVLEEGREWCSTPCKHEFHKDCLISYANFNNDKTTLLCPVCRQVLFERPALMAIQPEGIPHSYMEALYGREYARHVMTTCACLLLLLGLIIFGLTIIIALKPNGNEAKSP